MADDPVSIAPPPTAEQVIGGLNAVQYDHWRMTGELPESAPAPPAAPSAAPVTSGVPPDSPPASEAPEQPAAPPESGDVAPTEAASGPAAIEPESSSREPRDWKGLRAKARDLERSNIALQAKLEVYERERAGSRPSAPAAPAASVKPAINRPTFPDIMTFPNTEEGIADYTAAVRKFESDLDSYLDAKWDARQQSAAARHAAESSDRTWAAQEQAAAAKYSDYEAVVYDSNTPASLPMIGVLRSRADGAELSYWLGKHPAEAEKLAAASNIAGYGSFAELQAAAHADPRLALKLGRAMGAVDAYFDGLAKPKTPATPTPRAPRPTGEVAVVPRGTPVTDPIAEAIKNGDIGTYIRLANEADLAEARARR